MISIIQAVDKLRFLDDNDSVIAVFDMVAEDNLNKSEVEMETEIVVPIYGNVYIRYINPTTANLTRGTFGLEGSSSSFSAVKDLVLSGSNRPISLVIGGTNFPLRTLFRGLITGVSYQESLLKPASWVTGQVSFIKL